MNSFNQNNSITKDSIARQVYSWLVFIALLRWINIKSWISIGTSFVLLTLACGYGYYWLSYPKSLDGLEFTNDKYHDKKIELSDCLYFSIITETTVGYGDLAPQGGSRAVACFQVLAGLVLAGLAVSSITSRPSPTLQTAIDRTEGKWIELTHIIENEKGDKDRIIISLVTIAYVDGILRYDGDNIDELGNRCGFFSGKLQDGCRLKDNTLVFDFSNRQSRNTVDFDKGETVLTFGGLRARRYTTFAGHARESKADTKKEFAGGYRADREDERWINSDDRNSLKRLADKYCEPYRAKKVVPQN